MNNSFRTEVFPEPISPEISHNSKIFLTGSCFTTSAGSRFQKYFFDTAVNPSGIHFNPLSAARALERMIHQRPYHTEDLSRQDDLFFSFDHHGSFSSPSAEQTLGRINDSIDSGSRFLQEATHLFITFGSAFAYYKKSDGEIVANCHRLNPDQFKKSLLTPEGISSYYEKLFDQLFAFNPGLKVILTVSPIRHTKEGSTQNQLSKSTLILACHRIISRNKNISYFPSYEIIIDDLRDYRFYNSDMIHLSQVAEDYIWNKLEASIFSPLTRERLPELAKLRNMMEHKPIHLHSKQTRQFMDDLIVRIDEYSERYPDIDFSPARRTVLARIREITLYS